MKRDLNADLAICEAATPGPYNVLPSIHSEYPYEVCETNFLDTIVASVIHEQDAQFIAEAREGWPHAIRRALEAERWIAALVEALDSGSIRQARLSSGTDYVIHGARECVRKLKPTTGEVDLKTKTPN